MDQPGQQPVAGVGIEVLAAGFEVQPFELAERLQHVGVGVVAVIPETAEGHDHQVVADPARVVHEMPNPHRVRPAREIGEVLPEGILERQEPLILGGQHRRRRELFGYRGHPEDRIRGERDRVIQVRHSIGALEHEQPPAGAHPAAQPGESSRSHSANSASRSATDGWGMPRRPAPDAERAGSAIPLERPALGMGSRGRTIRASAAWRRVAKRVAPVRGRRRRSEGPHRKKRRRSLSSRRSCIRNRLRAGVSGWGTDGPGRASFPRRSG